MDQTKNVLRMLNKTVLLYQEAEQYKTNLLIFFHSLDYFYLFHLFFFFFLIK